jgi:hypothetical protein
MPTNIPVTYTRAGVLGVPILNFDILGLMNSFNTPLNDLLNAILTLDKFLGFNVTSAVVSGAQWFNYHGDVALGFQLTTVSDPITAADIGTILAGLAAIIGGSIIGVSVAASIASGGLALPAAVPAIIVGGSILAGLIVVTAGAASIVQGGGGAVGLITGAGTPWWAAAAIVGGVLAVGGVLGYLYLKEPKRRAQAHRYVGKAKSIAGRAYRRVRRR